MGLGTAKALGPPVHQGHKGGDIPRHIGGQHVAGVVAGGHRRAVEQIPQSQLFTRDDAGAAAVVPHAAAAVRSGDHPVLQAHFAPFRSLQHQQHGHHLGEAGGERRASAFFS